MSLSPAHDDNAELFGDRLFGVCATVGEDIGFNPLWLRLVFAITFLMSPAVVIGVYVLLGVVAYLARWLMPDRALVQPAE